MVPDNPTYLKNLLSRWNIDFAGVLPGVDVPGSPDRTLRRMVIVDSEAGAFVLEEISPQSAGRKNEIAELLRVLSENGLKQVHPFLADRSGQRITVHEGRYWQLRGYIPGTRLARPGYLDDSWRGAALAEFLIALDGASLKCAVTFQGGFFSIVRFIDDFAAKLKAHHPGLLMALSPVLHFLAADFFRIHDTFPVGLCHGDYHPLNVIWSEDAILSVIDWEFCGDKPEIYDLALLIGCLGIEDPHALTGALVDALLRRIGEKRIYREQSRKYLLEWVIALRFAWLSEWLRKNDGEMVRLEMDYMTLLLENRSAIGSAWCRY